MPVRFRPGPPIISNAYATLSRFFKSPVDFFKLPVVGKLDQRRLPPDSHVTFGVRFPGFTTARIADLIAASIHQSTAGLPSYRVLVTFSQEKVLTRKR
jgi:hypothetical protein